MSIYVPKSLYKMLDLNKVRLSHLFSFLKKGPSFEVFPADKKQPRRYDAEMHLRKVVLTTVQ